VALYVAYVVPVVFGLLARRAPLPWTRTARWSLGRAGALLNVIAIAYSVFICFVLVMPPNQLAGKTLGAVVLLLVIVYWTMVKRKFNGPVWAASTAILQARDSQE
jgi:amino acid transporter